MQPNQHDDGSSRRSPAPPGAWGPLHRVVRRAAVPIEHFLHVEAASGVVLLLAAVIAFSLANSPWSASYAALWHTSVEIGLGPYHFARSLEWVINDGLMAIFFFVVGLEIRREIHCGELSELKRAALPIIGALGGVLVPAGTYLLLAGAPALRSGWAVPTATDIAFAVGVLALLGPRVPPALRVLLLALAVIDDLAAIVVIAAFYSEGVSWSGLLVAACGIVVIYVLRAAGVRSKALYVPPGLLVWAGTYAAGIHPTIAGVVIGLLTPVQAWIDREAFVDEVPGHMRSVTRAVQQRPRDAHAFVAALRPLVRARREAVSPAEALIEWLHPWVAFAIMPLFALANAGVSLDGVSLAGPGATVALAVGAGLVIGKPLGIIGVVAMARALGVVRLPAGLSTRHVVILGVVAGIGFTMALFIAQLAFSDAALLGAAKLGVLVASVVAGGLGLLAGRLALTTLPSTGAATSAAQAEASTEM